MNFACISLYQYGTSIFHKNLAVVTNHNSEVIMGVMASQITSLTIVYSTIHSGADQRKHQSSASLAFVREIHRWPVNSRHRWPVTRKMFPFDDVIMILNEFYYVSDGFLWQKSSDAAIVAMSERHSRCDVSLINMPWIALLLNHFDVFRRIYIYIYIYIYSETCL